MQLLKYETTFENISLVWWYVALTTPVGS